MTHPPDEPAAAHPAGVPAGPVADPRPDGGVVARVHRRTAVAAAAVGVADVVVAALGWWRPGWFDGVAGAVIGSVAVALVAAAAAALATRAAAWRRAQWIVQQAIGPVAGSDAEVAATGPSPGGPGRPGVGWARAVVGEPIPIHRRRAGSPRVRVGRRLAAQVLPLRAAAGSLSAGRAVILHPRQDGLLPRPGDRIQVHEVGHHGPFLIRRADGVTFVADAWPLSTL